MDFADFMIQFIIVFVAITLFGMYIGYDFAYQDGYEAGFNEPRLICISETEAVDLNSLHYSIDCTKNLN